MTPERSSAERTPRRSAAPTEACADALLRAAVEACRQHERVGRVVALDCADDERHEAAALCELADRHLVARTAGYETTAAHGKGKADDDRWHAANALWHASREYLRRHRSCDARSTKLGKHSSNHFGELTMEYELEASAMLVLRQAIANYRKLRPDAE